MSLNRFRKSAKGVTLIEAVLLLLLVIALIGGIWFFAHRQEKNKNKLEGELDKGAKDTIETINKKTDPTY